MNYEEETFEKVAMLLAVIDLIECGLISENRIAYDHALNAAFNRHFNALTGHGKYSNPYVPFFYLRNNGFWHHHIKPGKADAYSSLSMSDLSSTIIECISFSYLDDELFELLTNGVVRELFKISLNKKIDNQMRAELLKVGSGWDWLECEAIVQDYFVMLSKEIGGIKYNKAEHRRRLMRRLNKRSEGSIEFKHQNISAVLIDMGQPYIQGYKPAFNYQQQLKSVVLAHIAAHESDIEHIAQIADVLIPEFPAQIDWATVLDPELPERICNIQEPKRQYLARKINYTERECNNRKLGKRGEAFVIEYERYRLEQAGRKDLAREVEWSSNEQGDGLGYDVRSFNHECDEELFIEVKTTNSGKYQPFFISENEVAFSKERERSYSLYRVYDFRQQARIYQLNGAVDRYVNLQPQSYRASFSG
ncbi:DUF3883 domain-containing protein [Teredinibacter franksiae]|uniref:DUF3883 domain-containing protein n=1 Tax=Teredinibacter franksiae TaxID=2761453 RepID=UPI001C89CCFB|nr:DUF3883 domain-containing protein [Teredinibacter franksiae]